MQITRVTRPVTVTRDGGSVVASSTPSEVVVLSDADGQVVVNRSTSVVSVTAGTVTTATPRTHLTEFTPDAVYVGTAPVGTAPTSPSWRLWKVVDTDPHPLKTPDPAGRYAWTDRATLTYVDG